MHKGYPISFKKYNTILLVQEHTFIFACSNFAMLCLNNTEIEANSEITN